MKKVGREKKAEGIILAAGASRRFHFKNGDFNKYLLKFNGSNLLCHVIVGMLKAGIKRITVVTGKISSKLKFKSAVYSNIRALFPDDFKLRMTIIANAEQARENGYSLYLGLRSITSDHAVLSMADHVFSQNVYSRILAARDKSDILLATDPMISEGLYDLNDATKILGVNNRIADIGKTLIDYNRLDMGVFVLKTKTIKEMCKIVEAERYRFGVTDVVLKAIECGLNVKYADMPGVVWLDVDDFSVYYKLRTVFGGDSGLDPFEMEGFNKKQGQIQYAYKEVSRVATTDLRRS